MRKTITRKIKQGGTRKSSSARNIDVTLQVLVSAGILTAAAAAALRTKQGQAIIKKIFPDRTARNSTRTSSTSTSRTSRTSSTSTSRTSSRRKSNKKNKDQLFLLGDSTLDNSAYYCNLMGKQYNLYDILKPLINKRGMNFFDFSQEVARLENLQKEYKGYFSFVKNFKEYMQSQYAVKNKSFYKDKVPYIEYIKYDDLKKEYMGFNAFLEVKDKLSNVKTNFIGISILGNDFNAALNKTQDLNAIKRKLDSLFEEYKTFLNSLQKLGENVKIIIIGQYLPHKNYPYPLYKLAEKILPHVINKYRELSNKYKVPFINTAQTYNSKSEKQLEYYGTSPIEPGFGTSIYVATLIDYVIEDYDNSGSYEYYIDFNESINYFKGSNKKIMITKQKINDDYNVENAKEEIVKNRKQITQLPMDSDHWINNICENVSI